MRRHKHLAVYGLVMALVVAVGALAIWSFIERQSLVVVTEPLPKVTVVTQDSKSRLAAAWVRLLMKAGFDATLVTTPASDEEGVVVYCDLARIPQAPRNAVYVGLPPAGAPIQAERGASDTVMHLSEAVSPLLARLVPGIEFASRPAEVALLNETPQMVIDARWRDNARAAVMHVENANGRMVWFGFDPDALNNPEDTRLLLLLRTAFRWVDGQPISDGAVGELTAEGRRKARAERFAFSVDRLKNPRMLSIRMMNRGTLPIEKPTVKIWLPPGVTGVQLAGDLIMRRGATIRDDDHDSCLITLPILGRNEDRIMKLKVVKEQSRAAASVASR